MKIKMNEYENLMREASEKITRLTDERKEFVEALEAVEDWWTGKVFNGQAERMAMWEKCKKALESVRQREGVTA